MALNFLKFVFSSKITRSNPCKRTFTWQTVAFKLSLISCLRRIVVHLRNTASVSKTTLHSNKLKHMHNFICSTEIT